MATPIAPRNSRNAASSSGDAADPAQDAHDLFGIGFDECTGGPQQQEKDHKPEQNFRHS
jgi:hypothetical protein